MAVKIRATLYHANWCHFCTEFMPEWDKFSEMIGQDDIMSGGATFLSTKVEAGQMTKMPTINGKMVTGYPTVKIEVISGGQVSEIEYKGKRDATELGVYVKKLADVAQKKSGSSV